MEKSEKFTNRKRKRKQEKKMTKEQLEKQDKKMEQKNENAWKVVIDYDKDLKNEKFEFYYRTQLSEFFPDDKTWQIFLDKLKEKLPCVFRINKAHQFSKDFLKILLSPTLVKDLLNTPTDLGIKIYPKQLIDFPSWKDLVYNINIPRMELKKNESLTNFHKFIQKSVDAGLISRQEAVSMLPPMVIQAQKTDSIIDLCAAPGSKTAQFLEVIYDNFDFLDKNSIKNDTGFVLANDNNPRRAFMMIHQLQRLNTAGMIVVCHDAQFFPTIFQDEENQTRVLFDKILADVPCSSDAVLRKIPSKWLNWSTKDSFGLHKLQIQILKRGINLLKVGGYIIYSTCSLNPIEDEAVVSEIMKTQGKNGKLEIVNMEYAFKNSDIKINHGIEKWGVYVEDKNDKTKLVKIENCEDPLYKEYQSVIEPTCFPPTEEEIKQFNLKNCMRLLPHDNDTSGFFITLIKKVEPVNVSNDKPNKNNINKIYKREYEFLYEKFKEELDWIINYFGIDKDFPKEQLITQSNNDVKKINFISKGLYTLLKSDKRNQLKFQNAGVKIFSKDKLAKDSKEKFNFRLCQDGLMYLIPYMHKRIFFVDNEMFKNLLIEKELKYNNIKNEKLVAKLKSTDEGSIVIINMKQIPKEYLDSDTNNCDIVDNKYLKENFIDAICCYKGFSKVSTMINKENLHVYELKYNITIKN